MSYLTGTGSKVKIDTEKPGEHILSRTGYTEKLSKNVRIRRRAIKKSIRKTSFNSVYRKIEDLQQEVSKDYKERRLREDLNWLKSNSQRFDQSIF